MCGYYSIKSGLFKDMFLVSLNTSLLCGEKWYPIRIYTEDFVNPLRDISKRDISSVFDREIVNKSVICGSM